VDAEFPGRQRLAEQAEMTIRVRNAGSRPVPNLAVTVDRFSRRSQETGLADASRPVWIVDREPEGGTTAYANTWSLDGVPAGQDAHVHLARDRHGARPPRADLPRGRGPRRSREGGHPRRAPAPGEVHRERHRTAPRASAWTPRRGEVVPVETPAR
jgi:hypothetical protein